MMTGYRLIVLGWNCDVCQNDVMTGYMLGGIRFQF